MSDEPRQSDTSRRDVLAGGMRGLALVGLAGATGWLWPRQPADAQTGPHGQPGQYVWQIDPAKCIACGRCATECVLDPSAVKCVHSFAMCGYCELCTGYFVPDPIALEPGPANQLCPTDAIVRECVEEPYFEYRINEEACIACGRCVKGCNAFGNGSLYLQIRHDRCVNCNECSIARVCPSGAIRRVPADQPYLLKETQPEEPR